MKYSNIIEELSKSGTGAVLPERYRKFSETKFRLWTLARNFPDQKEARNVFPSFERQGILVKLGGYTSISAANYALARAREKDSLSRLFLIPPKRQTTPKPKPFGIRRQSRRKVITV